MEMTEAVFQGSQSVVDTHCHYNLEPLEENWRSHWEKAQSAGVSTAWIPGTTVETSRRAWEIAQEDRNLWALAGVHPSEAPENSEALSEGMSALRALIIEDKQLETPKILGIGEIGLDYFRLDAEDNMSRERQRAALRAQLALAQEFGLFVSLHVRDTEGSSASAYEEVREIVAAAALSVPCILHCASGPLSYVAAMLKLGAYVGFDGNITYPKADHIREIWRITPPDHRLLETDAPYLPPQPFRGQVCEPWMILETARWIESNLA